MEGKIKLIEIIADSSLGGGPRHVLDLVKNIDKELFEVYIICPGGFLSAEVKQIKNITVFNIEMRSKFDLVALWSIKKTINKIRASKDPFGPLIVHTHGSRGGFLGRLATPPHVKKVHTEHSFDFDYRIKNPVNEWLQKKIIRSQNYKSDLIVAVSHSVRDYLIKSGMAPGDKVVIIPNGIELSNFCKPTHVSSADRKAPVIGNVGNLNFQKGQIYLIDAMPEILEKYPFATLEIIGEGEERKVLEDEIKKLRLEKHVTLYGYKNKLDKFIKDWSVFVLPSVSETFGISILEAMRAGLPVVASRVGGICDIITQNKNGLLASPRDSKQLAKNILDLLDHPVLAAKLKRGGLERIKDFDWKKIIKKIEKEFLELFGSN